MLHQFNLKINLFKDLKVIMTQLSKKHLLLLCKTIGINVSGLKNKNKDKLKQLITEYENIKQTKIIASGKTIKYIYHCADIHIRTLERHDEYNKVFNNLYSKLSEKGDELNESVFVICGDIFHNRDRHISETIILFNTFLEKLTKLIDVVLIPGNHDIFTHTDRLDTISGIVDIKSFTNFYFLKYSGIYCYHNINFVVSSLIDNKFIKASEVTNNHNIKIALYHGSLVGSKLDNTYSVPPNNNLLKVSDFYGYDYVLLGDIHKKQYLTNNIAYPGSLIQQNFKEEQDHGLLKWDLIGKTSEFIKIDNDYCYITLHIKNNHFPDNITFPSKSRIKLIHDYSEEIDYEEIKKNISNHTDILSISKEIKINEVKDDILTHYKQTEEPTRDDLDNKIFHQLINTFNTDMKNDLLNIHINYLRDISKIQNLNTNKWYITQIQFKNIYIYGNNNINTINFSDKQGIIGILANNAAGKSSILNIILYTLFGNITKTKSYLNRNIINKGCNAYFIKMEIVMNNIKYTIYREGKNKSRKNGGKSMEETIKFSYKNEENNEINITDTNKIVTQEKIKNTFGLTEKDIFILTNVMNYSNYISILNMTSSEISSMFSKLFNLEYYKDIYSLVLKKCKHISDNIKLFKGEFKGLKDTIKNPCDTKELNDTQKDLSICNKELQIIEEKLEIIIKKEASIHIINLNMDFNEEEEENLSIELNTLNNYEELFTDYSINEIKRLISQFEKDFPDRNNKISCDISLNTLKLNLKNIKFNKLIKPCTTKEFNEASIFINNFKNLPQVSDLVYDENGNIIISKNSIEAFKTILNMINDTTLLQLYIDTKILINDYNKYLKDLNENKSLEKNYSDISYKINYMVELELDKLKNKLRYLEISEILKNIKTFKINKENIDKKNVFKNQRKILELDKNKVKNEINKLVSNETTMKLLLKQQENSNYKLKDLNDKIKSLEKEEILYKNYKSIINDRSLPKLILKNTIKKLELEANNMIYSLAGLLIFIDNDSDSDDSKWELLIKKNNMILGSEQVSGYERFVINVGIKMALDKYKFYSGSSIFFIDEAFDCVSEENLDNIDKLFSYLKSYYKNILIISHNEELKKKIDHRINIETDYTSSKIC